MKLFIPLFAQEDLGTIGGKGLGPFGEHVAGTGAEGLNQVTHAVSSIIGVMTLGASVWFIFQFLVGGLNWITSGGDKGKLKEARDRLTNAFIGLVIVVAGWSILALTGKFLGFDILLRDTGVIERVGL